MSELDTAMMKYISHIVLEEHRPFSYRDFLRFEVNDKEYGMQHGTFRNKISRLMHARKVELAYKAGIAFYTLKGISFGKPKIMMTPDHTGVQDPIIKLIGNVPTRIFPIALPSKVDNVERVFNGYKKKYVDKVLCEFITR